METATLSSLSSFKCLQVSEEITVSDFLSKKKERVMIGGDEKVMSFVSQCVELSREIAKPVKMRSEC